MSDTILVNRTDIELIAKIESLGLWVLERYTDSTHTSYDIWLFNGQMYKIYKDSVRL